MTFNAFVASARRTIFADLEAGRDPSLGEFDPALLAEARAKGKPGIGAMEPRPREVVLEFPFSGQDATVVFPVRLATPERVVSMPVPEWVVENVWQGTVDGSYVFEREAFAMLARFQELLADGPNATLFGPRPPVRRE
jgi:hypothetical protein